MSVLDEVKVVLALIETVRDGRSSSKRCVLRWPGEAGGGMSYRNRRPRPGLMTTHTGAMAVPEKVLEGVLESLGVVVGDLGRGV